MLDIKIIRETPDIIRNDLERRDSPDKVIVLEETIKLDTEWRAKIKDVEELKKQNELLTKRIEKLENVK